LPQRIYNSEISLLFTIVSSTLVHGKMYSIHHYVINFSVTCDMLVVFSTNKTDLRDKTDILLKVALNTISLNLNIKLLFTI